MLAEFNLHSPQFVTDIDEVGKFCDGLWTDALECYSVDKRSDPRFAIAIPAMAAPFMADGAEAGDSFPVLTRDISRTGISILHTERNAARFLCLDITPPRMTRIVIAFEVLRTRQLGPFWESAGRFVIGGNRLE